MAVKHFSLITDEAMRKAMVQAVPSKGKLKMGSDQGHDMHTYIKYILKTAIWR